MKRRMVFTITPEEYPEMAVRLGESELQNAIKAGVFKVVPSPSTPKPKVETSKPKPTMSIEDMNCLLEETYEELFGAHVFEKMRADAKAAYEKQRRR